MYNVVMKKFIKELLQTVLMAIALTFFLLKFVMMPCVVEGSSMEPILKNKDFGYSFILTKNISINRFDIVVINVGDKENEKLIVKRVIGLPGETVSYVDNQLYINGELVNETFLNEEVKTNDFTITLSADEYCCLGDNRSVSRDSRYYGAFKNDEIVSSHLFILYPLTEFGVKK